MCPRNRALFSRALQHPPPAPGAQAQATGSTGWSNRHHRGSASCAPARPARWPAPRVPPTSCMNEFCTYEMSRGSRLTRLLQQSPFSLRRGGASPPMIDLLLGLAGDATALGRVAPRGRVYRNTSPEMRANWPSRVKLLPNCCQTGPTTSPGRRTLAEVARWLGEIVGGRDRFRTCGLCRVKAALSR
jgi:hypothetical protein